MAPCHDGMCHEVVQCSECSDDSSNSVASFSLFTTDGEQFSVPVYLVERSKVLQGLCDIGGAPAVPLRSHELRAHLQFTAKTGLANQTDAPADSVDRSHVLNGLIQVLHVRSSTIVASAAAHRAGWRSKTPGRRRFDSAAVDNIRAIVGGLIRSASSKIETTNPSVNVTLSLHLCSLLQAADYLEDDETVLSAARFLAEELFLVPGCLPFVTEVYF